MNNFADYLSFCASQISQRVFELMRIGPSIDSACKNEVEKPEGDASEVKFDSDHHVFEANVVKADEVQCLSSNKDNRSKSVPFELYKRRTTIVVRRETFLNVVCDALTEYKYVGPNQRADLVLACR